MTHMPEGFVQDFGRCMRWERGLHQKELGGIRGRATAAPTSGLLWQHPGGRPRIYLATNILRRGTKANHGLFTHDGSMGLVLYIYLHSS